MRTATDPGAMTPPRARAVLAVRPDATAAEIDAAFRRAIRHTHPDHGGDATRAQVLLDARRCLRQLDAPRPTRPEPVVVVPARTWRDVLRALLEPLRLRPRPHRPPRVH